MKRHYAECSLVLIAMVFLMTARAGYRRETVAGASPSNHILTASDLLVFSVDHPNQYPQTAAVEHRATLQPVVTITMYLNSQSLTIFQRSFYYFST
jgi:hypothetical protein